MIYYLVTNKKGGVVKAFEEEADAIFYVKDKPHLKYEEFDIEKIRKEGKETKDDLPF